MTFSLDVSHSIQLIQLHCIAKIANCYINTYKQEYINTYIQLLYNYNSIYIYIHTQLGKEKKRINVNHILCETVTDEQN